MSQDQILTEEQAHDGLLQEYSDAYKALMGFRPHAETLHMCDNMELYAMVQDLYDDIARDDQWEAEQVRIAAARKDNERRIERNIRANGIGPTLQSPLAAALQEVL